MRLLLTVLATFWAFPAMAHLLPTANGQVDARTFRTSHGLAMRAGDEVVFVCPTRWGGPERPLVVASGGALVIASNQGLVRMTNGRSVETIDPTITSTVVTALAAAADEVFWLRLDGRVYSLNQESPVVEDHGWQTLDVGTDRLLLSRLDDGALWVAEYDLDGNALRSWSIPTQTIKRTAYALYSGGEIYAAIRSSSSSALYVVQGERLVQHTTFEAIITGPIHTGGVGVVLSGDRLMRLTDDGAVVFAEDRPYTCIANAVAPQACSVQDIFRVDGNGVQDSVLSLSDIVLPYTDDMDRSTSEACLGQWYDFETEAFAPILEAPAPKALPEDDEDTGCAAVSSGSGGPFSAALWLLPLLARRRRASALV